MPTRKRRHRQQLAFLHEVGGEEDAQRQLGQLDGLAVDGTDPDPQTGPVVVLPQVRDEGGEHQRHGGEQQQVAVAVEVAGPAHQRQGQDVGAHPRRRPPRLGLRPVLGDAGQHHVAQPVQQGGDGQEDRAGVGGVDPVGDVRGQAEPEHDAQERPQVGRDLRGRAHRGEDVGGHHDEGSEDEQPQLGPPLGLGTADPHALGGREATQESGHRVEPTAGTLLGPGHLGPWWRATGGTLDG